MTLLKAKIIPEWASGDRLAIAEWKYGVTPVTNASSPTKRSMKRRQTTESSGGIAYHRFCRQTQLLFSEIAEQSEYGSWFWATDNVNTLTHQSGSDVEVRGAFTSTGALANSEDNNFRAINDSYPTFGFAVGLGSVGTSSVSTLFTLGHAQEQAVQFDGSNGNVSVPTLWTSYYPTELDAVSRHFPIPLTPDEFGCGFYVLYIPRKIRTIQSCYPQGYWQKAVPDLGSHRVPSIRIKSNPPFRGRETPGLAASFDTCFCPGRMFRSFG